MLCDTFFLFYLTCIPFFLDIAHKDFLKAYYLVGKSVLERGSFVYIYQGFTNLPLVSLLCSPLGILPLKTAARVFLFSEICVYFLAFVIFLKFYTSSNKDRWFLLLLFLFSRSYFLSIQLGQLTPHAFLLLILMLTSYLDKKPYVTGILLGSAFLLKIPLGLLFLYFLFKKEYKVTLSSIITYLVFLILSIILFGVPLHLDYFHHV